MMRPPKQAHLCVFLLLLVGCYHGLMSGTFLVVSAQQGGGGFEGFEGFGGQGKICRPFRCPQKDQEPVPKWPLKLISPGCSGMGGVQMFSPGSSGGDDDQGPCCDIRHACLQTCGVTKAFCDEEFLKCTKATCTGIVGNAERRKKCDSSVGIHELMIKMDKCTKFEQEQYSHCECVSKGGTAESKREQVLRAFYKKFSPESMDKVPALANKAKTDARKMAGLLLKLYKKFPQVIKKVKDPQQEYMERMMKDAERNKGTGGNDDKQADAREEEEEESDVEDLGVDEL